MGTVSAAPQVRSTNPDAGVTGANIAGAVTVTFSEAMDVATVNTNTVWLRDASNALVPSRIIYSPTNRIAHLIPTQLLVTNTSYTATVKGGAGGVKNSGGQAMAADYVWTFTTVTADPHGAGPGGPLLVLTSPTNAFTRYYAEMLQAEGLNAFALRDLSTLSSALLTNYDVVILGQMGLSSSQVTTLSNWVMNGGKLVAMRPDKKLAGLLGLVDAGSTMAEGYLGVNTASGPGVGIVGETMQFHGTADRYTLAGATVVATLYSNATGATTHPAVTMRSVGGNGGWAAAFTYDLARSVVFTRQGNPAWQGQERDGYPPVRSDDLFFGGASFDPQPDWVDLSKVAIPQADEQQRLLANLILQLNLDERPLPRFWYFPDGHRAVIVMTGDDHGNGATKDRFDQYAGMTLPSASFEKWQTIRGASYIYNNTPITDAQAANYLRQGFEIGLHVNTDCANYTLASYDAHVSSQLATFRSTFPSLPLPTTHRIHCIAWSGYTIAAEVQFRYGMRLDVNYYHLPEAWIGPITGFMTGSGMPMRFATTNGTVINVYQAATQMTDESGQAYPPVVDTLLDRALGPEGYYGAFVANMHTDFQPSPGSLGSDAIVASATNRGVPVVSADQMLTWVDARNRSFPSNLVWNGTTLAFSVKADANARGLQALVPVPGGLLPASVRSNGVSLTFLPTHIKGVQYAQFPVATGGYEVEFAPDTTPPVITSVTPTNGAFTVGVDVALRVGFSEALDPATVTTNGIRLTDALSNAVPLIVGYEGSAFELVATPVGLLAFDQTYTATVLGGAGGPKDVSGNALANQVSWSFTTAPQVVVSLWPPSAVPAVLTDPDTEAPTQGVEVGLKFRSALAGYISALRYYRGPTNPGPHLGNLWTANGTRLASVTFSNETASGWQQQTLPVPVPINADTTYVVSYHAPQGGYSTTPGYFAYGGATNWPLHALSNTEGAGNGLYRYGPSSFPDLTYNAENYWVDVVFQTALASNTPPTAGNMVVATPEDTATNLFLAGEDAEGPVSFSLLSNPTNGVLSNLDPSAGTVTYQPAPDFFGADGFQYRVTDGSLAATGVVNLTVTPVDDPPRAEDLDVTLLEDQGTSLVLTVSDTDSLLSTNATLDMAATALPDNWMLGAGSDKPAAVAVNDGDASYIRSGTANNTQQQFAAADPVGLRPGDTIGAVTVQAVTKRGGSQNCTFALSVVVGGNSWTGVAHTATSAYTTFTDTFTSGPGGGPWTRADLENLEVRIRNTQARDLRCTRLAVSFDYSTSLTPPGVLFAVLDPPAHGVLTDLNATNGAVTYTPTANYFGPDEFRFTADAGGNVSTGRVSLTVQPVNDAPVFLGVPSNLITPPLRLLTVTNLATDVDSAPLELVYQLIAAPAGAVMAADGLITWTPSLAQAPSSNAIVSVVSDGLASATNSFTVEVLAPAQQPQLLSISVQNGSAAMVWTTVAGYRYVLESAMDEMVTNWLPVLPEMLATNSLMTAQTPADTVPVRLYRVRVMD